MFKAHKFFKELFEIAKLYLVSRICFLIIQC